LNLQVIAFDSKGGGNC